MKIIFGLLLISLFVLQGCYTIVWDPMTMEFPREDNSESTPSYYEETDYYGRYSEYYNRPWWYSISPPSTFKIDPSTPGNQGKSVESLRESNGGRNQAGRENSSVSPPSRSSSGTTSTSTSSSSSDSRTNSTDSTTNEGNTTKRESTKSNDTRQTRSDGERSSDPKRR